MRHNASGRKLGRKTGHRLSLFRNQLASLIAQERIVTTVAKAKELRPLAERMITHGKKGTVHARRLVGRWVPSRELIKKLFDEIAPRFSTRPGGYLRIVKLGSRQGDGAELAILEFVDFKLKTKSAAPAESESKPKKAKPAAETEPQEAKETKSAPKRSSKPRATAAKKDAKADVKSKAKPKKAPATAKKTSTPKKIGS